MTINEIKESKYLLLKKIKTALGRLILIIDSIELNYSDINHNYYLLKAHINSYNLRCKVTHCINDDTFYIDINGERYKLISASNSYVGMLAVGDVVRYVTQPDTFNVKVISYNEKYRRFIVECGKDRHNLSTILKRFNESDVTGITTYDAILRNSKAK